MSDWDLLAKKFNERFLRSSPCKFVHFDDAQVLVFLGSEHAVWFLVWPLEVLGNEVEMDSCEVIIKLSFRFNLLLKCYALDVVPKRIGLFIVLNLEAHLSAVLGCYVNTSI